MVPLSKVQTVNHTKKKKNTGMITFNVGTQRLGLEPFLSLSLYDNT